MAAEEVEIQVEVLHRVMKVALTVPVMLKLDIVSTHAVVVVVVVVEEATVVVGVGVGVDSVIDM